MGIYDIYIYIHIELIGMMVDDVWWCLMMILFDIPSDELKPVVPAEIARSPEDSCDDTTDDLETGQFEHLLTISSTWAMVNTHG